MANPCTQTNCFIESVGGDGVFYNYPFTLLRRLTGNNLPSAIFPFAIQLSIISHGLRTISLFHS